FFSSRRRHTRFSRDWSSDVCSSDLAGFTLAGASKHGGQPRAMEDVVAQHKAAGLPVQELAADQERLRKPVGARLHGVLDLHAPRSEERRVGKEWRSRWSAYREQNNR